MTTTLECLAPPDVRPAARLHRAAFPGFFLSTLGERFLVEFYRAFLDDPDAVSVVARDRDGTLAALVVGTTAPSGFFGRLLRRRWFGFAAAAARTALTRPSTVPRLLRAVRYRGDAPATGTGALLSSICVAPGHQGTGLGRRIEREWLDRVAARGAPGAYLTTDGAGNDAVNAFYRAGGWEVLDTCTTPEGRVMNRYVKRWDAR